MTFQNTDDKEKNQKSKRKSQKDWSPAQDWDLDCLRLPTTNTGSQKVMRNPSLFCGSETSVWKSTPASACACMLSHFSPVQLCNSMDHSPPGSWVHGFSMQEYWSGLPCPPPGDLLNPGIEPASLMSPALAGGHQPVCILNINVMLSDLKQLTDLPPG